MKLIVFAGDTDKSFSEQIQDCEDYYNQLRRKYSNVRLINMQLDRIMVLGYFEYDDCND